MRSQISLRAAKDCVPQHAPLLKEAEWRAVLDALLQMWALDLLPAHLTEFDDFTGTNGERLESLCDLRPLFTPPEPGEPHAASAQDYVGAGGVSAERSPMGADASDGFLESLTRWFEDETRNDEDEEQQSAQASVHHLSLVKVCWWLLQIQQSSTRM